MVREGRWKPTDDPIFRPTKRRCIRNQRNLSSRYSKNPEGKQRDQNPIADPKLKNKDNQQIVPDNLLVHPSAEIISRPKILIPAPPRRSKRLREKVSVCIPPGVSVQNKNSLCLPKKKKKRCNEQREKSFLSTLTLTASYANTI